MSHRSVIVSVPLPATIALHPEALGAVSATMLLDVPVDVHLPISRPGEHHLFRPLVLNWQELEPEYTNYSSEPDDRPECPWGYTGNEAEPTDTSVSEVVLVVSDIDDEDPDIVLRTLRRGFRPWFDAVKDWIEALTDQDLDYLAPRRRVAIEGDDWSAWHGRTELRTSGPMEFDFDYGDPVSLQQWIRICELAGTGSRPSTEHLLLRDARGALKRNLHRRTVVDASTAMEIALYELLHAEFRSDQSKLAAQFMDLAERWTLGTLITNVSKIVALPAGLTTDLVHVRNKVVHRSAYTPTPAEAQDWLDMATAVVSQANPRPAVP